METRINTFTTGNQNNSAVAMDAPGDYVVAWQSAGQDGSSYGIYAQRYNAAGATQGSEFRVNTFTTGAQTRPTVAMDATGDFAIVWQSNEQDGNGYGVFAQRYNAAGIAQGSEFKVNAFTTGLQGFPSVAMDATGDFAITWESYAQDGISYGVYAQRYNATGIAQGVEFKVNAFTLGIQNYPAVAMDAAGDFVITWQSVPQDGDAYGVYAQRYSAAGAVRGSEFRVNTYVTGVQNHPSAAMDSSGNFAIVWESLSQDGSAYGLYAQRYNAAGAAQGSEFPVNTYALGVQDHPSIAMDPSGDFAITWESSGQDGNGYGIYMQRYKASGIAQGSELQVNTYTTGNQAAPSVAMDAAGNFVIAWQSASQDGSGIGIYARRYASVAAVGPIVISVLEGPGPRVVQTGDKLTSSITSLSVNFSDDMNVVTGGANSVINPSNWRLTRYGIDISNQISGITFGFNVTTNHFVAVVSFAQPLTEGAYQLIARQTIQDLTSRTLDGEADGVPGGDFRRNFYVAKTLTSGSEIRVNTYTTGTQDVHGIATDAVGDYVVVWQSDQDGSSQGIYAQRYNAAGVVQGGEFQVNTYTTGAQTSPCVAMDAVGDFVISWTSQGQDGSGWGVFAQRYNATGVAQGAEFLVNTYTTNDQIKPTVAMDAVGDFVIAWDSNNQDGSLYGVNAQRYNAAGVAQGGGFQVNTYTTGNQTNASVAMDAAGDFAIAWMSDLQDGNSGGIFAQRYNAAGVAQGGEFQVNTYTTGDQINPSVAMDAAGEFAITWQSDAQDGSGFGVDVQRYNSAGIARGNEFLVNTYTTGFQCLPSLSMDAAGDFVITWQSATQDGAGYGIQAQRYSAAGIAQGGEFQVNSYTTNNQKYPSVAMDSAGDFAIAWGSFGQDGSAYGVYAQRYKTDVAPWLSQIEGSPLNAVGSLSTPITSSLLAFDVDSNNLSGATIQISINDRSDQDLLAFTNTANITGSWNVATGTLTLTGTDSVSNYRTALRSVTYHNTSGSPNTLLIRTVDFQVTDGVLSSNVLSRDVTVQSLSTPAVLSGVSGTGTYFENATPLVLAANLAITDPGTVNLASATVAFTNWQAEDRTNFNNIFALQHTFTQDLVAHTATFTITGNDTIDHYQTLLRSVVYWDVSDAPIATTRVANFMVSDGLSDSNIVFRNTNIVAINDPPLLSAIETAPLAYKANDPAFPPLPISGTLLVSEPDSNNLTKATVRISSGYQNDANGHDVLAFTNQLGITGSFDAATATLTLSGSSAVGNYRTAIRSITFSTSGIAVSVANRTLTIAGTDDFSPTPATSLPMTRPVTVSTTNTPPALTGILSTALAYVRGTAAVAVAPSLLAIDLDSINLIGATIQISAGYQNGQDILAVTNGSGITGVFNAATGTLTLSGTTTLNNYTSVLRTVTYKTNTAAANTLTRTIGFTINDGLTLSSTVQRNVTLT